MLNKEPKFVMLDKKNIIGVTTLASLEEMGSPEPIVWGLFYNINNNVSIKRKAAYPFTYELEIWSEKDARMTSEPSKEKFMYMVGVEVDDLNEIPHGCIGKTLPAGEHAIFTYTGKPIYILRAYMYIFKEWFPKSGITMAYNYNYAYYKKADSPHDSNSEIEIFLPIKR
ncbi:hypothetical protein GC096_11955 [Paenibacillus sp. LMG 31461]|uniref:AraC effector-binding domain-containing protein n=1 Tax=Paenibacillus plantarum TaxID=2654975 RepID=A0ABX1X8G1_9BACL|nr:GyrI-like domain-containing protein [Paenibacillus plantarum]NOU64740.1 hypothetical protein [Paenibacillus plantarum]